MQITLGLAPPTLRPQVITGTPPDLAPLVEGDLLSSAATFGEYTTTSGTIVTPTVKEISVNDAAFVPFVGATVAVLGSVYQLRETVTTTTGRSRAFRSQVRVAVSVGLG
jgi:hypothetical protein